MSVRLAPLTRGDGSPLFHLGDRAAARPINYFTTQRGASASAARKSRATTVPPLLPVRPHDEQLAALSQCIQYRYGAAREVGDARAAVGGDMVDAVGEAKAREGHGCFAAAATLDLMLLVIASTIAGLPGHDAVEYLDEGVHSRTSQ